jgi:hypothetical protein
MMKTCIRFLPCAIALWLATHAYAVEVNVTTTGVVDFNVIGGNQSGIPAGAPVVMSSNVDSDNFVDSPNFPTRGYPIILPSFSLTVGGMPINIDNPQSFGTAYFVLRNNDPAVDGFVVSRNIDFPQPVGVHVPGLAPEHELNFLRTFNDGTPFPSLNILDALGTYDQTNLSVYNWTVGRFGNPGAEYMYQTISLSVVPEPAASIMISLGVLSLVTFRQRTMPTG